MNLRNLFKAALTLVAGSLLFVSCEKDPEPPVINVSTTNGVTLVGNCKKSDMSALALTFTNPETFKAAAELTAKKLQNAGTHVIGVRVNIPEDVAEFSVFAGEDYQNPTTTKTATWKNGGWQYVIFDTPIEIKTANLYIGYSATLSSFAVEEVSSSTKDLIYTEGDGWANIGDATGYKIVHAMQAIVAGGDYSNKTQVDMAVDVLSVDKVWALDGESVRAEVLVRNNGVKTIKDVTVNVDFCSSSVPFTISDSLMNGQSYLVVFEAVNAKGTGVQTIKGSVNVDGDKSSSNNSSSTIVRVYADEGVPRNSILLEQFTAQKCGWCPNGARILKQAIEGMTDKSKLTWVAHHAGFGVDDFTLSGSQSIATGLSVSGAPMGSLNRMLMDLEGKGAALNWYLGMPSSDLLNALVSEPGQSTLNIERTYNAENGALEVKVSGKSSMETNYLTVIVTQSGMVATQADYTTQAGSVSNYSHDNAPRMFLTAGVGDKVEIDADGNFAVTLQDTIPAQVDGYDTKAEDMEIVAFVHGAINGKTYERYVYNADKVSLVSEDPASVMMRVLNNNRETENDARRFMFVNREFCQE